MNIPPDTLDFKTRTEKYQLALSSAQRAATCLSASIEACINEDIEKADYFYVQRYTTQCRCNFTYLQSKMI